MSTKLTVAVLFGSRNVEHEVSVVTGLQIIEAIDKSKYDVIPIYVTKTGQWLTGPELSRVETYKKLSLSASASSVNTTPLLPSATPGTNAVTEQKRGFFSTKSKLPHIDVLFPAFHGTFGEDGTMQGLFELANIPYVGCGVTASAVGMDKVIQKAIFAQAGLNIIKYTWFPREEYQQNPSAVIAKLEKTLLYPMIVKPANLGSSVGISLAKNQKLLEQAIKVAQAFDRKIVVEEALIDMIEINCSVLGWKTLETSVCEQPIKQDELLSYDDKYMRGEKSSKTSSTASNSGSKGMASLDRLIPAPISPVLTKHIQEISKTAFRSIDGSGIARVDLMVTTTKGKVTSNSKIYVNEINTMPGSLSFYLWEPSGVSFTELTTRLIELAIERQRDKDTTMFSIDSSLLENLGGGVKQS